MLPYWRGGGGWGNYYLTTDITDFTHKDTPSCTEEEGVKQAGIIDERLNTVNVTLKGGGGYYYLITDITDFTHKDNPSCT